METTSLKQNLKMSVVVAISEMFLEVRGTFPNLLALYFLDILLNTWFLRCTKRSPVPSATSTKEENPWRERKFYMCIYTHIHVGIYPYVHAHISLLSNVIPAIFYSNRLLSRLKSIFPPGPPDTRGSWRCVQGNVRPHGDTQANRNKINHSVA